MKAGIYRGSRRQKGGAVKKSLKRRKRQKGGLLPFVIPPLILAGLKGLGTATALGAAGAMGQQAVEAISNKIRGGAKKVKKRRQKWI